MEGRTTDGLEATGSRAAIRWGTGLERRRPGARYGVVLVLLMASFVFLASAPEGSWVPLVNALLQGATLTTALVASEARPRLVHFGVLLMGVAVAGGLVALFGDDDATRGASALLSLALVGVAPVAIAQAIRRRPVMDIHMVLGAICIYVFIGVFFSFLFLGIGNLASSPFFVQQRTATPADYLYFSFVTMTTVGYGDLTAAGGLARSMAVLEALLGQIYLVTVVALLVGQLARRGRKPDQTDS